MPIIQPVHMQGRAKREIRNCAAQVKDLHENLTEIQRNAIVLLVHANNEHPETTPKMPPEAANAFMNLPHVYALTSMHLGIGIGLQMARGVDVEEVSEWVRAGGLELILRRDNVRDKE